MKLYIIELLRKLNLYNMLSKFFITPLFVFILIYFLAINDFHDKSDTSITQEGNLWIVKHYSHILQKKKIFRIFLPQKNNEDVKFPALYVLHGVLCHSDAWPEQTQIDEMAEKYNMVMVFPDAENSYYLDSPIKSNIQYESYLIEELIPFIEDTFPVKKEKSGRGVMGASMGGHGAMMLGAKYSNLFSSVSSLFGILKLTDSTSLESELVAPFLVDLLGPYSKNKEKWEENSSYELAEKFLNKDIAIFFNCGKDDETPAFITNIKFHERLSQLNIPHIWKVEEGGHTSEFLNDHLKEHLDFHSKYLTITAN